MSTINGAVQDINNDKSVMRIVWADLAQNDDGAKVKMSEYADRSVQVFGTFGAGGTVRIEGSNDGGTTWAVLSDPQGNALDVTTAKIEAVTEIVQMLRPRVTAGDGTTSLTVALIARRARG